MAKALITTKLTKARDTKGTFVYKNDAQDAAIPSLYIKKTAFKGDAPETITITIE
jgi:hypothetical protein